MCSVFLPPQGGWHNIVLALFCLIALWTLPLLLAPAYDPHPGGVTVTHVASVGIPAALFQSPPVLAHPQHVRPVPYRVLHLMVTLMRAL